MSLCLADVHFGAVVGGGFAGDGDRAHLHQCVSGIRLSVSLCIVKLLQPLPALFCNCT